MWFNDLPNGALQISFNGRVEILDTDQQRQLGKALAQRGMVTKDDLRNSWPEKSAAKSAAGPASKKWARKEKSPQAKLCDAIPDIIAGSERGMTLEQVAMHFHGTVAKRTIYESLNKMVKEGTVIKKPNVRDMRVPMYFVKKVVVPGEQNA